jgi:hypothetical protein
MVLATEKQNEILEAQARDSYLATLHGSYNINDSLGIKQLAYQTHDPKLRAVLFKTAEIMNENEQKQRNLMNELVGKDQASRFPYMIFVYIFSSIIGFFILDQNLNTFWFWVFTIPFYLYIFLSFLSDWDNWEQYRDK